MTTATSVDLVDEVVPFVAGDGMPLNLIHVRATGPGRKPTRGPVLLVHGAGVRANIFRAPTERTLVDELVREGYDVWLENWRASIDLPPSHWTLDEAALHDHPAAVRKVLEQTGADSVKAVIHCQGSTSFAMSATAGLLPDVSVIVSNAVSLHPVVNRLAKAKLRWIIPPTARALGYLDPQWGIHGAPFVLPKAVSLWVRMTHHECDSMVCKLSSYIYGTGEPTLWLHENLNTATHDWLANEFARVPTSFFAQINHCVQAGHLVRAGHDERIPKSIVSAPPKTDARWSFFAGSENACFTPESQRRTHAWFTEHKPAGGHTLHVIPKYGHLDIFMGFHAATEVFPLMLNELEE